MELNTPKIELETIKEFLLGIEFFKNFGDRAIDDLARSLVPISVEGGTVLINQGDLDTTMYILFQGRLRVVTRGDGLSESKELVLAEISPGQLVGEIALLTHLPRTTTVRTVRDSILLKFDEHAFKLFEEHHPVEVSAIAKMALKRVAARQRPLQMGENIVSIAIAPAGASNHRRFIARLFEKLNQKKPTILVNKELCSRHFGRDTDQIKVEDIDFFKVAAWLQQLENQYGYLLYETDQEMTPWTQLCIRQADRLIFAAEHSLSPDLNSIEKTLFSKKIDNLPYLEIVFIHPDNQEIISGTEQWLKNRLYYGYHHLKLNSTRDLDKFVRFLNGQAFAVVLNGGGARGLAHIGALKALDELNIPIDFIGGTSMGAIVGAGYASVGLSQLLKFADHYSRHFFRDWTLPVLSLLKGKYNADFFQDFWQDIRIEDLWTRFFCVSTNLTQGKLQVHDHGLLRQAIRSSTSVPAIYPPVFDEEGNMFVDGAILNNMPVDVMRQLISGGKILAVNCNIRSRELKITKLSEQWISGWRLFFQRWNPFSRQKISYDNIFSIVLASNNLSVAFKQQRMEKEADYVLGFNTSQYPPQDFRKAQEIIEMGYRTSMEKLPLLLKGTLYK